MNFKTFKRATLLTTFAMLAALPVPAQLVRIGSAEITVERILVDAHALDLGGVPILDLQPTDFRVSIDGMPAEIESLEWVDSTLAYPESNEPGKEMQDPDSPVVPLGRLIVIFVQTDFQRARQRLTGQMKTLSYAKRFVGGLTEYDRVAVVSFDSHLKLRQDFTGDRKLLDKALDDSLLIAPVRSPQIGPAPSLFSQISFEDARKAPSSENALLLIGNALLPIPGPKSLVMFGWGLGTVQGRSTVTPTPYIPGQTGQTARSRASGASLTRSVLGKDYALARRALDASRTSVFALDITEADYHTLEAGLSQAAEDTGGFYEKTFHFPSMAIDKLQRVLAGHYVLVVKRPPDLARGVHDVEVELRERSGEVLARKTYADK